MSGSKPSGSDEQEPTWVEKARQRGRTVEEVAGTFVMILTDEQPLWEPVEADRDRGGQDSGEQVAVRAPANDK